MRLQHPLFSDMTTKSMAQLKEKYSEVKMPVMGNPRVCLLFLNWGFLDCHCKKKSDNFHKILAVSSYPVTDYGTDGGL